MRQGESGASLRACRRLTPPLLLRRHMERAMLQMKSELDSSAKSQQDFAHLLRLQENMLGDFSSKRDSARKTVSPAQPRNPRSRSTHAFARVTATSKCREALEEYEQPAATCAQGEFARSCRRGRTPDWTSGSCLQAKSKYQDDAIQINALHAQASLLQGKDLDKVRRDSGLRRSGRVALTRTKTAGDPQARQGTTNSHGQ